MVNPHKRQKVRDSTSIYKEEVLFNSDTLSKVISYLPPIDLLNLALTCKRFGISNNDDNKQSLIEKSTCIAVHELATEEQLAALPHYEGESSLADYHYLQLLRAPLAFDQLVDAQYVNIGDKSCVMHNMLGMDYATAISNNVLRAGKHYASFELNSLDRGTVMFAFLGVMRPGEASPNASGSPLFPDFFQNFFRRLGHVENNINNNNNNNNNNINDCCLYYTMNGASYSRNWSDRTDDIISDGNWDGLESMSPGDEIGMLLDVDEGTLSVYKNRRKLGVVKRGLTGQYCWAVSIYKAAQVTIERGTIPPS